MEKFMIKPMHNHEWITLQYNNPWKEICKEPRQYNSRAQSIILHPSIHGSYSGLQTPVITRNVFFLMFEYSLWICKKRVQILEKKQGYWTYPFIYC